MKITIFTSNQIRHNYFINSLAKICDTVYAVQECNTIFPGKVQDFYAKSAVMQEYFKHVIQAESDIYGQIEFTQNNVKTLPIKSGDLNFLDQQALAPALESDLYIVFGASFIKGWLIDYLVEKKALNIHMGVSPYYRGSSCNFWALYDRNPHMVGATIHYLSKGLDSGPILYNVFPHEDFSTPFHFTMLATLAAQKSLVEKIKSQEIFKMEPHIQDKTMQIRYTKNNEFNDQVAQDFLNRKDNLVDELKKNKRQNYQFIKPYYLN